MPIIILQFQHNGSITPLSVIYLQSDVMRYNLNLIARRRELYKCITILPLSLGGANDNYNA